MILLFGNGSPLDAGEPIEGESVTVVHLATASVKAALAEVADLLPKHTAGAPTWVASDDPVIEAVFAQEWGVETRPFTVAQAAYQAANRAPTSEEP